jgi:transcriptional regulator of acetoin/glycerol metabolism
MEKLNGERHERLGEVVYWRDYLRRGQERGFQKNILESWERCTRIGLNPYEKNLPQLIENPELKKRLEQHSDIVELFQFYMKRFTNMLEQVGACSFVCDGTGYVLSRVGYGKTLNYCDDVSIREGASCNEASIGTNAPGLALITREPVVVTADEHYSTTYHPAFCVASPILDENRELLGCVDITKFFDRYISEDMKKHLLSLAISLSDMIRNEVFLGKIIRSSPLRHAGFGSIGADKKKFLMPPVGEPHPYPGAAKPPSGDRITFSDIVGRSPLLSKALRIAQSYSRKEGNILIQGETGTGKEMLARAIHSNSGRSAGPFVVVNAQLSRISLRASFSDTREGHSPVRKPRGIPAGSKWPMEGPSSWMKSIPCRSPCRRRSCAPWNRSGSPGSTGSTKSTSMSASSPPATKALPTRCRRAGSARTSISA